MSEALKSNSSLSDLSLGSNNIGDKGAEWLSAALKSNSSLTDLSLFGNNIGEKGAEWLSAAALKSNSSHQTPLVIHDPIISQYDSLS